MVAPRGAGIKPAARSGRPMTRRGPGADAARTRRAAGADPARPARTPARPARTRPDTRAPRAQPNEAAKAGKGLILGIQSHGYCYEPRLPRIDLATARSLAYTHDTRS